MRPGGDRRGVQWTSDLFGTVKPRMFGTERGTIVRTSVPTLIQDLSAKSFEHIDAADGGPVFCA